MFIKQGKRGSRKEREERISSLTELKISRINISTLVLAPTDTKGNNLASTTKFKVPTSLGKKFYSLGLSSKSSKMSWFW